MRDQEEPRTERTRGVSRGLAIAGNPLTSRVPAVVGSFCDPARSRADFEQIVGTFGLSRVAEEDAARAGSTVSFFILLILG